MPNCNDGSNRPPRMRLDINGSNIMGLPKFSTVPRGDDRTVLSAVKAAGFEGIQTGSKIAPARELGMGVTGSGRINTPEEADLRAADAKRLGYDCYTAHVGWGIEDDDQVYALLEATLRASERHRIPIYIETHRATITDDIWRTVQLVGKFPEIRFNGDFSHWYTGHEMVYGDIQTKWAFMQPVFERVRFIHGRIGNPGCMQVDIGDGSSDEQPYVEHFKEMWTRGFIGFLKSAKPGDFIPFTPELLGPEIYYARVFRNATGEKMEEGDRWEQAQLLARLAMESWAEAEQRLGIK